MGRNILNLYKLVRYDIKNGLGSRWYVCLGAAALGLLFCAKLYADYMGMLGYLTDPQFAMGNLLICYFQGKKPYSPEYGDPFVFPASWMVLFLLCSFLTLDYPFHNLNGHGVQVVTRMRSRRVWWASKCIWVAVATLFYFILLYTVAAAFCIALGIPVTLGYGTEVNEELLHILDMEPFGTGDAVLVLCVLPAATALAVNAVQLVLGFFLDRIYCFLATAALLFASAYFHTPFLIGNYAMVERSVFCTGKGPGPAACLGADLIVAAACVAAGFVWIQKYDIMKKKDT